VKYKTSAAFRRALEERFRQQSLEGGQPLTRLRKMVAFDRFLARLAKKEPEAWIVKGGFALQLRLGTRARTTKDIDVSLTNRWTHEKTTAHLRAVASLGRLLVSDAKTGGSLARFQSAIVPFSGKGL